ncbi:MAG: hypothetical protein Ta2B_19610 [Termitinemataceae bacterium]|nr:MAG: hypothetical protein Ta2B_19610 [Termitinemataceae bacterium]
MGRKVIELDGELFIYDDIKNCLVKLEIKNDVKMSDLTPKQLDDFLKYVELK